MFSCFNYVFFSKHPKPRNPDSKLDDWDQTAGTFLGGFSAASVFVYFQYAAHVFISMCFCGRGETTYQSTTEGFFGFILGRLYSEDSSFARNGHQCRWALNPSDTTLTDEPKPWEGFCDSLVGPEVVTRIWVWWDSMSKEGVLKAFLKLTMVPVSTAEARRNPENGEQLCHFWGYSTVPQPRSVSLLRFEFTTWRSEVNFFVPMQRFSSSNLGAVKELSFVVACFSVSGVYIPRMLQRTPSAVVKHLGYLFINPNFSPANDNAALQHVQLQEETYLVQHEDSKRHGTPWTGTTSSMPMPAHNSTNGRPACP